MRKISIILDDLKLVYQIYILRKQALLLKPTMRYGIFLQIVDLERERFRLEILNQIRDEFKGLI